MITTKTKLTPASEAERLLKIKLPSNYKNFINKYGFIHEEGKYTILGHEVGMEEFPSVVYTNKLVDIRKKTRDVKELISKTIPKYKDIDILYLGIIFKPLHHFFLDLKSNVVFLIRKDQITVYKSFSHFIQDFEKNKQKKIRNKWIIDISQVLITISINIAMIPRMLDIPKQFY